MRVRRYPPGAPCASTYSEYTDWLAAMNSRLRFTPPKQTLAQRSGSRMRPISLPSGANTATPSSPSPPEKPHQTLPSVSQRMPSA